MAFSNLGHIFVLFPSSRLFTLKFVSMSINVISVGETDRRQLIGEQTRLRRTNAVVICVGDEIEGCEDDTLRSGLHGLLFETPFKACNKICVLLDLQGSRHPEF